MSNPLVHAFFVGRALAEAVGEQLENTVTNTFSELGKFDAEQRERLRQFTTVVLERAQQEEAQSMQNAGSSDTNSARPGDLQQIIDDLRAETAELRAELQRYRNSIGS